MSLRASPAGDDPVVGPAARTAPDGVVAPDYAGGWLGAVVPALLAGDAPVGPPPWVTNARSRVLPPWVATARSRVLLLVDGLGWQLYQRFAGRLPSLAGFTGSVITSVVPSTTATALPSLTTGRTPAEHGMLGDRMRVGGTVLSVLQWTVPDGAPPDPTAVQPHAPFGGGPVAVVSGERFAGSGFTRAHLRGVAFDGYDATDGLVERVVARVRAGTPLVYAYVPDVDRTAHERGFDHDAFGAALTLADGIIAELHRRLPADVPLVVTSDHGHVTADPRQRVDMAPLAPLVGAVAGSPRLRYLHARPGAARDLLAAATELAAGRALVTDRAGLIASGWLGPRISPVVAGRLGDVIMAALDGATMVDASDGRAGDLVTMHGSVTPAEMLVPLLVARGAG